MDSTRMLREERRLLAAEYGMGEPALVEGEDLESDDIADAEHWVDVYSRLVDITRGLLERASTQSPDSGRPATDRAPKDLRALMIQAQIRELHLTYWVNRLTRLRQQSGSDEDTPR